MPSYNGMEHDEFDTPAARYLLWIDEAGDTRGVARLLPTTCPYMLKKLWPNMISGELPQSDSIWEATRFGCDQALSPPTRRRAVAEILCAMQEFGLMHGIGCYLAVMPLRLLQCVVVKAGCRVAILGPSRLIGRFPTVAAYLTVSSDVLDELRCRAAIGGPLLCDDVCIAA